MITKQYLKEHPNEIFVFGDNTKRFGQGGAAILRYEPNVYGFVTKIYPSHNDEDYYTPKTYEPVLKSEMEKLQKEIEAHPDKTYLISKLGAGLANRYNIRPMIEKAVEILRKYKNVKFLD